MRSWGLSDKKIANYRARRARHFRCASRERTQVRCAHEHEHERGSTSEHARACSDVRDDAQVHVSKNSARQAARGGDVFGATRSSCARPRTRRAAATGARTAGRATRPVTAGCASSTETGPQKPSAQASVPPSRWLVTMVGRSGALSVTPLSRSACTCWKPLSPALKACGTSAKCKAVVSCRSSSPKASKLDTTPEPLPGGSGRRTEERARLVISRKEAIGSARKRTWQGQPPAISFGTQHSAPCIGSLDPPPPSSARPSRSVSRRTCNPLAQTTQVSRTVTASA